MLQDDEIQARIQEKLTQIEATQQARILYAVESGSRAWGFASPDSDYDVRFIYVRNLREYARVVPRRDVIELPVTETLDINGWDIFKALALFRKSNPPLLEWLHSPIIYRERGDFAAKLRALAQSHFSVKHLVYHYLSMAKSNFRGGIEGKEQVSLKKYLYVMRPLICIRWLEQNHIPPPTSLWNMLDGIELANEIRENLSELLERKRSTGELGEGPSYTRLNAFILEELERIAERVTELPSAMVEEEPLNALAWAELEKDKGV